MKKGGHGVPPRQSLDRCAAGAVDQLIERREWDSLGGRNCFIGAVTTVSVYAFLQAAITVYRCIETLIGKFQSVRQRRVGECES